MKYFVLHVAVPNPLNPEEMNWLPWPPTDAVLDETQVDHAIRQAFYRDCLGVQVHELKDPDVTVFCIDHWKRYKRGEYP